MRISVQNSGVTSPVQMQALVTTDYRGGYQQWPNAADEEEDGYPLSALSLPSLRSSIDLLFFSPLVMKVRSRASSVMSGASTPGGGKFNTLSEVDLKKADAALQNVDYHDEEEEEK